MAREMLFHECLPRKVERALLSAAVAFALVLGAGSARGSDVPVCPAPTVVQGGHCALASDVEIDRPLRLGNGTKLNCGGYRIEPVARGTADLASTEASEYTPSQPEVAILLDGVADAKVQNCVLEGFDFGIVIANRKGRGSKVLSNTIRSQYTGVVILRADGNKVAGNTIVYGLNASGKGVWINHDSDRNRIVDNHLSAPLIDAGTLVPILPGSNRFNDTRPDALRLDMGRVRDGRLFLPGVTPGGRLSLLNMVIEGQLYQFPLPDVDETQVRSEDWGEGNVVKGNVVETPPGVGTFAVSVGGGHRGVRIFGNEVRGGGAHFSGPNNEPYTIPGRCSLDAGRLCMNDDDCFIPGVDVQSKGTCPPAQRILNHGVADGEISDNRLSGPFAGTPQLFSSAISTFPNSVNAVIAGNEVTGTPLAVLLFGIGPLTTATVTRNTLAGNAVGLGLRALGASGSPAADHFAARVSLNDITGSTDRAVGLVGPYGLLTELSAEGRGNYWGHTCEEGGFLPSDSPSPSIVDSHPFGTSVAGTPERHLPATCPEQP